MVKSRNVIPRSRKVLRKDITQSTNQSLQSEEDEKLTTETNTKMTSTETNKSTTYTIPKKKNLTKSPALNTPPFNKTAVANLSEQHSPQSPIEPVTNLPRPISPQLTLEPANQSNSIIINNRINITQERPQETHPLESDTADNPKFGNSDRYPLPSRICNIDRNFISSEIIKGSKLCFVRLNHLLQAYFKHNQLLQLANLNFDENTDNGIDNALFFVCIGTKKAYNETLTKPVTEKSDVSASLFIEKSPNYKTLFVDFLKVMFDENETDVLEKSYN
jgi:hypothetical protein